MKSYKTKINKEILELAKSIGTEIRVAPTLKDANIDWLSEKDNELLSLYTNGIIFVKSESNYKPRDLNLVVLHEIGHVFIQHHQMRGFKIEDKTEEIAANCISFSLAYLMGLKVSDHMIEQFNKFNELT
ncbi:hypothetical protein ACWNT8_15885 (plasmid) [Pigmentibacter ruber]|nr:hypothetical protein GTC16762_33220 [Pigmentibacter ruber]